MIIYFQKDVPLFRCKNSLSYSNIGQGFFDVVYNRHGMEACSSYDNTGLMPVSIIYGEHISHKVYIYKIKPKNKYREECG